MAHIEIDKESGFCNGVVTAIRKAEEELDKTGQLYCLGDIVHNSDEVERLRAKGLVTITHAELERLHDVKVLLRAHGEPPETYEIARRNNIEIIDATCPVVLTLQRRIKKEYDAGETQILIYGKTGHAEVNGLVGQTAGNALVIQDETDLDKVDFSRDIALYSQTTKSISGFRNIVDTIAERKEGGRFEYFDTICRQVANRMPRLKEFAKAHQVVLFVCGEKSSNGRVLYGECKSVNEHTYMIQNAAQIEEAWFDGVERVGICGATSTPRWLMNDVQTHLERMLDKKTKA